MTNTNTTTLLAISTAVRTADGWYDATVRTCGRFCTEALVDTAELALAGLTSAEIAKFASSVSDQWARKDRDWAIQTLCAWCHAMRLREWGAAFERSCAAARAELPAAIELLGACL